VEAGLGEKVQAGEKVLEALQQWNEERKDGVVAVLPTFASVGYEEIAVAAVASGAVSTGVVVAAAAASGIAVASAVEVASASEAAAIAVIGAVERQGYDVAGYDVTYLMDIQKKRAVIVLGIL
jgi:hypothetical protein